LRNNAKVTQNVFILSKSALTCQRLRTKQQSFGFEVIMNALFEIATSNDKQLCSPDSFF